MGEARDETLASYDRAAARWADEQWATRLQRQMDGLESALPGRRVLDLGCGPGRDVEWLMERGHDVVGLDLSAGQLAEARRRVPAGRFAQADATAVPLPDASFDGIWCCSVFVHLEPADVTRALLEAHRVLAPGGALYLGLEEGTEPEWRTDDQGNRRRYLFWQAPELAAAVEAAGFVVTEQYVEHVGPFAFITTHATKSAAGT